MSIDGVPINFNLTQFFFATKNIFFCLNCLVTSYFIFLVDIPTGFTDTATALPVQIYIWSDSAERAFYERSSLAIMFLVLFLIGMNLLAVLLRKKFEKKW